MDLRGKNFEEFLSEGRPFHFWDGEWRIPHGKEFFRYLFCLLTERFERGELHTIETGAGSTTAIFLIADPTRHTSVNAGREVQERLDGFLADAAISTASYRSLVGRSEVLLPSIALEEPSSIDVALLDGGHLWPTVFVDFCYINYMLKKGGLLIIDDLQMYSVQQLFLLLKGQSGWRVVREVRKWGVLEKLNDERFEDWPQPYLVEQTGSPSSG
jgi:hypothetical protein